MTLWRFQSSRNRGNQDVQRCNLSEFHTFIALLLQREKVGPWEDCSDESSTMATMSGTIHVSLKSVLFSFLNVILWMGKLMEEHGMMLQRNHSLDNANSHQNALRFYSHRERKTKAPSILSTLFPICCNRTRKDKDRAQKLKERGDREVRWRDPSWYVHWTRKEIQGLSMTSST